MIVCHCEVVRDRAVVESLENGAQTLAEICRSTGAGRNCGACIFSLRRLLCQHQSTPTAPTWEVDVAAG